MFERSGDDHVKHHRRPGFRLPRPNGRRPLRREPVRKSRWKDSAASPRRVRKSLSFFFPLPLTTVLI